MEALVAAMDPAAMILTTEALVTDVPEKNGHGPAMPNGGGMGDY